MSSHNTIPLIVALGHAGDASLQLRFPPEYSEEVLELLDEYGISHNTAMEHSGSASDWIEVVEVLGVSFGSAGGLAGLAAAITAFVRRHDGKRFVFKQDGVEVDAAGYKQLELEGLLAQLAEHQKERDARMLEALGLSPE